ncbi:hypothetical protein [Georgenia faecalis]|uniref:Uncharacterized protein n=1 Tax=Georgenia faecalis TaxID=2483799 RepID=A0ABV9DDY3_9MICO|nr:hypothetical protein [Georgenia faecalis]
MEFTHLSEAMSAIADEDPLTGLGEVAQRRSELERVAGRGLLGGRG